MDSALRLCTQGLIPSIQAKTNSTPKTHKQKNVLSFRCIPSGEKGGGGGGCSGKSLISFQHIVFKKKKKFLKSQWLLKTQLAEDSELTLMLQYM